MQQTASPVSRRLLGIIAIVVAYVLTRVIYRTIGFPFTTLAEQSPMVRFGADLGMWLLICVVVFGLLSFVATRAGANRPSVNT